MQSYTVTATPHDGPALPAAPAKKRWILNAFDMSCAGHQSPGLWKHPKDRSANYHDIEYALLLEDCVEVAADASRCRYWTDLAKLLEKGKFNGIFVADVLGAYDVRF